MCKSFFGYYQFPTLRANGCKIDIIFIFIIEVWCHFNFNHLSAVTENRRFFTFAPLEVTLHFFLWNNCSCHIIVACIYAVGGGLCGLVLYRSGFVEFIGLCGAGCHFSYNPFVADPTFFLIHRYKAIAGEVIFLARWSGSVTESALQGISEKKFGIPLF